MFVASPWSKLAPVLFICIWASGYVVAKYAAPHADALTFLLVRYAGVLVLMGALAAYARAKWPCARDAMHIAIAGVGIHAVYLGGVWVAVKQGMPAGISALIVNLQPVLTAALAFTVHEAVSKRQWIGVVLGFAGVVLVVWPKLAAAAMPVSSVLLCVAALLGITLGTLYQKRHVPQFDLRAGQIIQFAASFVVTLPLALVTEAMRFEVNVHSVGALLWSIGVLTAGGISLMFMMLRDGKATAFTSTMYVVPSVTALMAWLMFGETLSATTFVGMAVTLVGVFLVVKK
jgi:drug/metabolite transporter (DMT)-like permease